MYFERMMCRLVLLLSGSNLLLYVASAGFECDFDDVFMTSSSDDSVEEFCNGWTMPLSDLNLTGFIITNGNESFDDTTTRGGPPKDYSLKTRQGHYALFMGDIREELREAELASPWFESSPAILHLEFAMNMYGDGERELGVFLRRSDKPEVRLWTAYGDKGTSWIYHKIPLGKISTQFQVLFRAIRQSGDIGHIALDAISIRKADHVDDHVDPEVGSCAIDRFRCETDLCISRNLVCDMEEDCLDGEDEANETCSTLVSPLRCDFEADTCGWKNAGNSGIIWKRIGGTGSKDGPHCDHTTGTSNGHYILVESDGEALGNNAIYESPLLVPPPREHYNELSELFNMCQLRFYYYMRGAHVSGLYVYVKERPRGCRGCGRNHKWLLQHSGLYGMNAWLRFSAPLPILSDRFVVQFEAIKVLPYSGAVAIDDISMTTECNNPTFKSQESTRAGVRPDPIVEHNNKTLQFKFTTCGMKGRDGPTQHQCDLFYGQMVSPVRVLSQGGVSGVQVWTIPESGAYTVTALGAAGGTGMYNTERGLGAYASAKFTFNSSDLLYVIVGQKGTDACVPSDKSVNEDMTYFCRHGRFSMNWSIEVATSGAANVSGGGGGGASYVFKKDSKTGLIVPLLVAGGAGGKSGAFGLNRVRSDGGLSGPGPGRSSPSTKTGPGAGGGIRPSLGAPSSLQSGLSLVEGSQGGSPCPRVLDFGWETMGGFGGGGGGCLAGGGGGGYTGGNVSISGGSDHNGQGGSSYISIEGSNPRFDGGANDGDGVVEVSFAFDCPCEFLCVYDDLIGNEVSCFCPINKVLAEDGLNCLEKIGPVNPVKPSPSGELDTPSIFISPGAISAVAVVSFAIVALLFACAIYLIFYHRRQRLKAERLLRLSNPECCVSQLRSLTGIQIGELGVGGVGGEGGVVGGVQGIVTEYNPTYDFGETKCTIQDLRELSRDRLILARALGQGAFGEVYQGYLSTRESGTIAVAAKTLPALCTSQAEMDFLMEAFIMSKFSHANIVKFLGVCFDKHPKLIVLELLNGGDVKTFLRESRPTPGHPSTLTYQDLIRLSLDVAHGCEYLELNHFIHRDVAARNCLLTTKGPDRVAKIADFGMARDIYRADYYRKGGKVMLPVKWMPPEAFLDGIFTSKTDVWSFGVLLWEVFSLGYMPYPGRGNQEVMELVTAGGRLEAPNSCPRPVFDLMVCCWKTDADQRPGFRQVIDQLKRCLDEPEVIRGKLPVFYYSKSLTAADDTSRQRWCDSRPLQSLHSCPTYPMEPSDDSNEPLTVSQFDETYPNNLNLPFICETQT